ncbi:peptidoglycan DD-metalloendopeptidase family protein [Candidatus Micrarchaeota archaeon]|nr:peptidoglycan DD-metalloendopeptidase family protein [Candidatus Micrarchaeota archaeon]
MRRIAGIAILIVLLYSSLIFALTLPSCPSNHICLFSGFTLEQIKPGPTGTTYSTTSFTCPVNAPVTGAYGAEYKNLNNEKRIRQGVEIRLPEGTDVRAASGGKVIASGRTDLLGYGRYVTIRHATNPTVETTYGYLQTGPNPTEGSDVKKGETIGKTGKSEANAFPSLYFELRRAGIAQRDVETICKTAPATVTPTQPKPVTTAGAYDVRTRAEFQTTQVQLAGVTACVKQVESACPQTGTATYRGRSWRTADPTCIFKKASELYHVPYSLLRSVLGQESGGRQFAESKYAQGYTQMTPGTAAGMGIGQDKVFDPYFNICGGVEYLSRQLRTSGNVECALAAYNAGPYDREVQTKNANTCRNHRFGETRNYVVSITAAWEKAMQKIA